MKQEIKGWIYGILFMVGIAVLSAIALT